MKKTQTPKEYARTNFGPPPENYVPGLGRGAVGFITRLDVGEAIQDKEDQFVEKTDNHKYEEMGMLNTKDEDYDDEDKEADVVYDEIDKWIDERRKDRRERKLKEEIDKIQKEKPTIAQTFADLKRKLGSVTMNEWQSIPEAQNLGIKKIKRQEKYCPVPDSVIQSARNDGQLSGTISIAEGSSTPLINLNEVGQTRGTILASQLDKQSQNVGGTSTVDKKGYQTALESTVIQNHEDFGDIQRAQKMMKSRINSDPHNPETWISAARIEEHLGKSANARNILHQGLQYCETSDDLWLETMRFEPLKTQKSVLAKAIQLIPKSYKIWDYAYKSEKDKTTKVKILKRALEHLPSSVDLWKKLIELQDESEGEARELLKKAVECVPGNVDMWLALAKLETYENAKSVINKARKALPTEPQLWIAAAKLEEAEEKPSDYIEKLLFKGIQVLKKNGYEVEREKWIEQAEFCERSQNSIVCRALAKAVAIEGLDLQNRSSQIMEDMKELAQKNSMQTCRELYNHCIEILEYWEKKEIINLALDLELSHQKSNEEQYLDQVIEKATQYFPNDENFWIKCTKDLWRQKQKARIIIEKAIKALPENDNILLLASKLEREGGSIEMAREYLMKVHGKKQDLNMRTYKHLMKFELRFGNVEKALELAQQAMKYYLKEEKIIIICAHVYNKAQGIDAARRIFKQGLEHNKLSIAIWVEYIELEMRNKNFTVARPLLEKARLKIPKNAELLRLAVKLEMECNNNKGALFILSKAVKEIPNDGVLWSYKIELEPRATRKKIINEALKICDTDPYVNLATAKLFWKERKYEKARRWLDKCIRQDEKIADGYAYLYTLEKQLKNTETAEELSNKI